MEQSPQERPKTTTVYAGLTWDDIVGAAALAAALSKKGYRVYVDLPSRDELSNLRIVRSYAVGIQPKGGVSIVNSTAMVYSRSRRTGYVFRYNENGQGEVLMKLSTVSSVTEVVKEYLLTISCSIELPQQLLDDVIAVNDGDLNRLSKVGRMIHGVHKLKGNDKNVRLILYNYAYNSILTKNLKPPQELSSLYAEYEKALKLAEGVVKEGRFMEMGSYRVAIISSRYGDDFIASNLDYLRPFASDILSSLCRQNGLAFLVYENPGGIHEVRACVRYNVSIARVVDAIPSDVVDRLSVTTTQTSVTLGFLDPNDATLENSLQLVSRLISNLSKA